MHQPLRRFVGQADFRTGQNGGLARPTRAAAVAAILIYHCGIVWAQQQGQSPKDITGSCKQQADDFVYPPPKNEKEAKKRAKEIALRERLDARPEWEKLFDHDYQRQEESRLWNAKFSECLHNQRLASAAIERQQQPNGAVPLVETDGHLLATIDDTNGRKAVTLLPLAAQNGGPSDLLYQYETPEHKTLFFYRDKNGSVAREVVPIEGQSHSFLDRNGQFMVSLDAQGAVHYVSVGSASAPPATATVVEPGAADAAATTTARPSTNETAATSGTLTCSGEVVPQNAEYVFRDLPLGPLRLDYNKKLWDAHLVAGEGHTQILVLKNIGQGPQNKCVVHWSVSLP